MGLAIGPNVYASQSFLFKRLDHMTPLLKILKCLLFLEDEVKFIFHQDASKSGLSLGFQTCLLTTTIPNMQFSKEVAL